MIIFGFYHQIEFPTTFTFFSSDLSRWALKIVVGAREQGTGNREQSFE